jgi:tetratricopeptide (TPR) repeat protein
LAESVKYDTCNYEKWTRLGFLHFLHANGEIGKLNAALGALQSALKLKPDSTVIGKLVGDCWYAIGLHHEANKDPKQAMTAFMRVDQSALMFSRAVEKIEAFKRG